MTRYIAAIAGVAVVAALVAATVAQANPTTPGTAFSIKAAGGPYTASAGTFPCELPNATRPDDRAGRLLWKPDG